MIHAGPIIATICARGGSKGLPGKNIRALGGKPLIVHSIEVALDCPAIQGVYVSTDDATIAQVSRDAGAQVPFLRPAHLATDEAPKLPALEHLVSTLESEIGPIEVVVDLQPTSPLRHVADIEEALRRSEGFDLVLSVCEARDNPYFNLVELGADGAAGLSKGKGQGRRQDAPTVYALNGSIYVWRRSALRQAALHGLWSAGRIGISVMPRERSVDIDDLTDFEYAQWLLEHRNRGLT